MLSRGHETTGEMGVECVTCSTLEQKVPHTLLFLPPRLRAKTSAELWGTCSADMQRVKIVLGDTKRERLGRRRRKGRTVLARSMCVCAINCPRCASTHVTNVRKRSPCSSGKSPLASLESDVTGQRWCAKVENTNEFPPYVLETKWTNRPHF